MDEQKQSESVQIFGEDFKIASDTEVDVQQVAAYVDKRMSEVAERSGSRHRTQLAVLAAMEIAAELLQAQKESEQSEHLLKRAYDSVDRLRELVDERTTLLPLTSEWIESRTESTSY